MAGNLARLVNIGHTQLHTVPKWLISGETALTARLHTQKLHFCVVFVPKWQEGT